MMMKRIALITGATSGIGEATARLLAGNSFKLILCGRREDRLQRLKNELEAST
jgi:3-hydroxy acid dehydrogenase/malonic semialdehyde reductase